MIHQYYLHLSFQAQSRVEKRRGWIWPSTGAHRSMPTRKTDKIDVDVTSVCPSLDCTRLALWIQLE